MKRTLKKIPRFMIAGTHSGVGKTTITTAIMAALTGTGFNVQPFKVGPDYIDPTYHTMVTGNHCRNMDAWILSEDTVYNLFTASAGNSDIAVIEGVMGLFDGSSGTAENGSSAHIAKILKCPVILIVDVKSMARSAAAIVSGFVNFDPDLVVAGVILNRIGSDRHLRLVKEAIETYCNVPVLGYVKKNAKLELPSRHLGLVPTVEGGQLHKKVDSLAEEIKEGINLDGLVSIANSAGEMVIPGEAATTIRSALGVRIGIAYDSAFSFYYQDGLDVLKQNGAILVPFSPVSDTELPENLDGIYIGGGFPEVFIKELAENKGIMLKIRAAGKSGMPVFAECGGLMYLTEAIVDIENNEFPMVGLVPAKCFMQKSLVGMGYIEAEPLADNIIAQPGTKLRGHEFHYSKIEPTVPDFKYAFKLARNRYRDTILDGYACGNLLASYAHLHFASNPDAARRFIAICKQYGESRKGCD